jgi:DNA polymerase III delta prime subunit
MSRLKYDEWSRHGALMKNNGTENEGAGVMKNVMLIGGTMGVGKTTTCQVLKRKLNNSVFLDGDWCWDMHPFQVTEETKRMVMDNICFLLNNFIRCSAFEHIVFCWVMHEQAIIDEIVGRLDTAGCRVHLVSLVCEEHALRSRLMKDVEAGIRTADIFDRSAERLPLYHALSTCKVDVTNISPQQAADAIIQTCLGSGASSS